MSSASDDDFQEASTDVNRRTFLLTLSQADLTRFPDTQSFATLISEAFDFVKSSRHIKEWACCQESHEDGGKHYHMAVNLSGSRRWNPIKNHLYNNHGVSVNFALDHSCGYVAAYRYVCKNKPAEDVLHSQNHSAMNIIGSPRTSKAMRGNRAKRKSVGASATTTTATRQASSAKKPKRLSNAEVASFMVEQKIESEQELYVVANARKKNGEGDLHSFILGKSPKALSDLVSTTWRLEKAPVTLERKQKARLEVIREIDKNSTCVEGCNDTWYGKALEVLTGNNIDPLYFAGVMRRAFQKGRQKNTNILITGPTNCGKSFLLNPLELIFKCLSILRLEDMPGLG